MSLYSNMIRKLKTPEVMSQINHLYGKRDGVLVEQTARLTRMIRKHEEHFNAKKDVFVVSAPGRVEIVGNHTDHNKGKVLAAAANVDTIAVVSPRKDMVVHLYSDGYAPITVDLESLEMRKEEQGTSVAIVRGIAAKMKAMGVPIGGFEAVVTSTVLNGSGLSSSAAFEVLVVSMMDKLYGDWSLQAEERAKIGQFAENHYMGKPTGLMDQMASSVGGFVSIDFKHEEAKVKHMEFDFSEKGYSIVVVNTGGNHADLTADYASIREEMQAVANYFGEQNLSKVRQEQVFQEIGGLRGKVSDRAILRSLHYFSENKRVDAAVSALKKGNIETFLDVVIASGESSF
ncbi:MAG: galactokinase, partial [Clostridiales bacterium]|nr:galactokinase [Clostridiales bacterium]